MTPRLCAKPGKCSTPTVDGLPEPMWVGALLFLLASSPLSFSHWSKSLLAVGCTYAKHRGAFQPVRTPSGESCFLFYIPHFIWRRSLSSLLALEPLLGFASGPLNAGEQDSTTHIALHMQETEQGLDLSPLQQVQLSSSTGTGLCESHWEGKDKQQDSPSQGVAQWPTLERPTQ
jgi:hypothetical protein